MADPEKEKESLARRTGKFFSPLNFIALAIILIALAASLMD